MAETRDLEATATEEPEVPAGTEADEEPIEAPIVETQGRKLVDVSVVASERKRAREKGERAVREKEVAPLQAKAQRADQLEAALAAAKPYIDLVRQHPEWLKPAEPSGPESAVPEAEAAQETRECESPRPQPPPPPPRTRRRANHTANKTKKTPPPPPPAGRAAGPEPTE